MKEIIPKRIIEKAVEGGWDAKQPHAVYFPAVVLDPTFWQALGKTLGWKEEEKFRSNGEDWWIEAGWIFKARRFYDLILTGQDTTKFWEELLAESH